PTATIKAKIDVVKEIREALTPTQIEIFEKTMFPHIEAKVLVKLSDVIDIFDKMHKRSLALEDNDAVRIYLLEYTYSQLRDALHKRKKIPRALAWELRIPFSWSRCCTLFVDDQLAPPLEILTPTKVESETDWWKSSLEFFKESRLLALEGDAHVSTLTQTVSSLQGTISTLESRLLALEGNERDFGIVSDGDI
nr:hypothetical protein [Tanacetum cinerariifolium]